MSTGKTVTRLTVEKVAERLAVTPRQVLQLIQAGELKAMCVSVSRAAMRRKYVVDLDDLESFERSRSTGMTTAKPKRRQKREAYPVYTDV